VGRFVGRPSNHRHRRDRAVDRLGRVLRAEHPPPGIQRGHLQHVPQSRAIAVPRSVWNSCRVWLVGTLRNGFGTTSPVNRFGPPRVSPGRVRRPHPCRVIRTACSTAASTVANSSSIEVSRPSARSWSATRPGGRSTPQLAAHAREASSPAGGECCLLGSRPRNQRAPRVRPWRSGTPAWTASGSARCAGGGGAAWPCWALIRAARSSSRERRTFDLRHLGVAGGGQGVGVADEPHHVGAVVVPEGAELARHRHHRIGGVHGRLDEGDQRPPPHLFGDAPAPLAVGQPPGPLHQQLRT
jgi:hypothetical protein